MDVQIRPYESGDQPRVREIAFDTAEIGERPDYPLGDAELLADLVTSYYTDHEPQSAWVAVSDGRVVGYVTGCLDTARYVKIMGSRVVPSAVRRAVRRGVLWKKQTWVWAMAGLRSWFSAGNYRDKYIADYPAHFHLNLVKAFRGGGAGKNLLDRFLQHATAHRSKGIHIAVRGDNTTACQFFEKAGFQSVEEKLIYAPSLTGVRSHPMRVYAKVL